MFKPLKKWMLLFVAIPVIMSFAIVQKGSNQALYFPSKDGKEWQTENMENLKWNTAKLADLKEFLIKSNTKSFIILVNGKIAMEEYFERHTAASIWQWNSAGKTLVGTLTGIAAQEKLLNLDDKVNVYLGNWTNLTQEKEDKICVKHLITMTTGLSDKRNPFLKKRKLTYIADAGNRWSYSNVFQKQMDVIGKASKMDFESYFNAKIKNKIGMDGYWKNGKIFRIYNSSARSMARFGLLALAMGNWDGQQVVNEQFMKQSITSSQQVNPSYGFFWWLNGKSKFMVPGEQKVYTGALVPNAPADMYAGMGAADNRVYVIPSKNMVIVRMGKVANKKKRSFAVSGFDNELWAKINAVIK